VKEVFYQVVAPKSICSHPRKPDMVLITENNPPYEKRISARGNQAQSMIEEAIRFDAARIDSERFCRDDFEIIDNFVTSTVDRLVLHDFEHFFRKGGSIDAIY
jgi:hypothetical protein